MNKKQTDQDNTLLGVRRRLLKGMLIALVVLGLPAVVISCIEAIKLGQLVGAFLYGGIYLFAFATTLYFHRLPFVFCTGVMLASLYVIAVFNFFQFSFSGAGIEIAITISVLATVLLGIRSGLITAAACLFTLISIGLCFVYGVIEVSPEMPATTTKAISWVTAAAVFTLLTGSLILGSGRLQEYLIRSLKSLQYKTEELKAANKELTREIKQRKMTEVKLKQSEAQFRTLFETAPDAIYLTDLEGILLDGNRAAEALIGSPREVFIGKIFIDVGLLPEMEIPKAITLIEKSRKGENTGPDELTLISSAGKAITVEIQTSPFQLEDRPVVLGVARDVSERKRLENQLQQAQKMESIGRLAGGVAHDFNNILSIIIGNADLALMDTDINGSQQEEIEEIKTAGERGAALTRQLLAFSRKQIIQPKILDLNKLFIGLEKMLGRLIKEDIEILKNLESALWQVEIDPGQMEQVIMNLTINARDAMPKGGNLTIETTNMDMDENYCHMHGIDEQAGSYVMLALSDTGIGMDKETQKHIFEPFYTTKERGKGTGLGLSTVYGIVKQNNGFVWVYSEPGKGSTFKIYLPRAERDAASEEKEQSPVIERGGSETILIVEDDDALLKLTGSILRQNGYKVLEAENGEDALRICKELNGQIELMLTDVIMPKMGGKETAERLQPLHPQMKIMFMSGYTDNAIVHHGVLAPEVNFLQKPFSSKDLVRKVREVLDKKQG